MKKLKKNIILIMIINMFFSLSFLYGAKINKSELKNYLKEKESLFGISYKIMLAIIKTESNFIPNTILINCYPKTSKIIFNFLKKKNFKVKIHKHYISVYPSLDRIDFIEFLNELKKKKYIKTFDIGLMQINESNLPTLKDKIKAFQDIKYNLFLGAKILYKCFKKFKYNKKYVFECYNKGSNYEKFNGSYFNRFYRNFITLR